MPYTGPNDENLPDNVKAQPESERVRWIERWNNKYKSCTDAGGDGDTCEAEAFRLANGLLGKALNELLYTCNQTAKVRREKLDGKQYLVAPVIAICEGVLNGELVTAEEIGAHFHSWDGRPFVIGHPKAKDGTDVSANEPETLAKFHIGQLFHTEFDDGKLKGELWIDLDRVPVVDGAREVVSRLEQGKPLEVSTAYFRDREEKTGKFGGAEYGAVARNLKPDHLAALLDVEGACSWEDGCGAPRVNQVEPGGPEMCVCPECGYEEEKERGTPCRSVMCPKCGVMMVAKVEDEEEPMENNSGVLRVLGKIASALGLNQVSEEVKAMAMSKEDMAKALAADELVGLDEDTLAGLDAGVLRVLTKLLKAAQKPKDNEDDNQDDNHEPKKKLEPQDNAQENPGCGEPSVEMQALVKQVGELTANVKALQEERTAQDDAQKASLIEELASNSACAFTKEQLAEMQVPHLKALKSSLIPADYSGQGGGPRVNADEITKLEMPDIFKRVEQEA